MTRTGHGKGVSAARFWRALACALLGVAAGCGPGRVGPPWRASAKPSVWPLPPAAPCIRHEGAIASGEIGGSRGGVLSLLDLLLGAPKIQLGTPHGIASDGTTLAIADSGRGVVHLLDLTRRRYRVLDAAGDTLLRCPIGVAPDGEGGLFVSDSVLARVFHFSADRRLLGEAGEKFVRPTGLAYDAARRRLHVVDTGAHAVHTFQQAPDGGMTLLRTLGSRGHEGPGALNFPTHAWVDGAGNLYVSDSMNHRIRIFDPDGRPTESFGKAGDGSGDFSKAKGVAADSEGHIYVVDSLYDVVQIFDRSGRFLLAFGGSGRAEGLLWLPTGIFIDREDRIYVADSGNSRVEVYRYVRQGP